MPAPAIAVLPYGQSLGRGAARLALDSLAWPLGQPAALQGGVVGDLGRDDHLIVYPKTRLHYALSFGTRARVSLLMGEPSFIHARHIRALRWTHRRFFRVLTFNGDLLARLPNALFFPYGTTWVPDWQTIDTTKSRHMSLIASDKQDTEGHKLRHEMVRYVRRAGRDVDVMGRGYTPFGAKAEGLAPYRFSIVIENMREANYFSEKLVDAILCETVPIYWGCPNLERFMDTQGIIQCGSPQEMTEAIAAAREDLFEDLLPHVRSAQRQVAQYCDLERRAAEAVLASL